MLSWHNRQTLIFAGQIAVGLIAFLLFTVAPILGVGLMGLVLASTAGFEALLGLMGLYLILLVLLR